MEKIKIFLIVLTIYLLFAYLIGAFFQESFNLMNWSSVFRKPFVISSTVVSMLFSYIISDVYSKYF